MPRRSDQERFNAINRHRVARQLAARLNPHVRPVRDISPEWSDVEDRSQRRHTRRESLFDRDAGYVNTSRIPELSAEGLRMRAPIRHAASPRPRNIFDMGVRAEPGDISDYYGPNENAFFTNINPLWGRDVDAEEEAEEKGIPGPNVDLYGTPIAPRSSSAATRHREEAPETLDRYGRPLSAMAARAAARTAAAAEASRTHDRYGRPIGAAGAAPASGGPNPLTHDRYGRPLSAMAARAAQAAAGVVPYVPEDSPASAAPLSGMAARRAAAARRAPVESILGGPAGLRLFGQAIEAMRPPPGAARAHATAPPSPTESRASSVEVPPGGFPVFDDSQPGYYPATRRMVFPRHGRPRMVRIPGRQPPAVIPQPPVPSPRYHQPPAAPEHQQMALDRSVTEAARLRRAAPQELPNFANWDDAPPLAARPHLPLHAPHRNMMDNPTFAAEAEAERAQARRPNLPASAHPVGSLPYHLALEAEERAAARGAQGHHRPHTPRPDFTDWDTAPPHAAGGRIHDKAKQIQSLGRYGDTELVHINPYEAMMLKRMGGSGTINPHTGLREYNFFKDIAQGMTHMLGPLGSAIGNGLPHLFGELGIDDPESADVPSAPPMTLQDWQNMQQKPSQIQQNYSPQDMQYPYGYAHGGNVLRKEAHELENYGRRGDTQLAHIKPHQAQMLQRMGGAGSINPATGLREYGPLLAIPAALAGSAAGASIGAGLGTMGSLACTAIGGALGGAAASALTGGNIGKGALFGGLGGLGYGMLGPSMGLAARMGMPNVGNFLNGFAGQGSSGGAQGIGGFGSGHPSALGGGNSWSKSLDFMKDNAMPLGIAATLLGGQSKPQGEGIASAIHEAPRKQLKPIRIPHHYVESHFSPIGGRPNFKKGGFLHGVTGGQADKILDTIPENSYVISADVVSQLGDGNSLSGGHKLAERFNNRSDFKYGGYAPKAHSAEIPARVSDGEFIVSPEAVSDLGRGDPILGSKKLDLLMKNVRKHKATKSFPPKAKSIDSYMHSRLLRS